MKIYNNMDEVTADVKNGLLRIDDDVTFNCDVAVRFNIKALNIIALNINAQDIDARDIDALNIIAHDINALNISYYAICSAYANIVCQTIKGRRRNAKHFALDGKVVIKNKVNDDVAS